MRSRALLVASLALLALAAPAQAAKVRCTSGATILIDGKLRVFAVREDTRLQTGWTEWACLGHAKPVHVSDDVDGGDGGISTWEYAYAGGRYLAVAATNEGENGADGSYTLWDLRTRRVVKVADATWVFDLDPQLRLDPRGDMVAIEEEHALEVIPRHGPRRTLSHAARNLALAGTTAYWTEGGAAHSAPLGGPASTAPDDHVVRLAIDGSSRCERRPGRTVARAPFVRVARHGRRLFACRILNRAAVPLPSHTAPATLRITGDHWLFGVDTCSHIGSVIDLRSGRTVTELPFESRWAATLLRDGTLAWIDDAGTLFARPPNTQDATTLGTGASALASNGRTVYWTAGGTPHGWRSPAPAVTPTAGDLAGCS